MKYGLTKKDMKIARGMLTCKSNHDWVMDVLRQVYQVRVKNGGVESEE